MEIVEEDSVIGIPHRNGPQTDAAADAKVVVISEIQQDADVLAVDVTASEVDVTGVDVAAETEHGVIGTTGIAVGAAKF